MTSQSARPSAAAAGPAPSPAARARLEAAEGGPLLLGDWQRALWVHYRLDPRRLQPLIPFELDLWQGAAYISLAAFSLHRLRLTTGGRIVAWPAHAAQEQRFFIVRTCVRHRAYPLCAGSYLLAEWLSNPLSALLGRQAYGRPLRLAQLDYRHAPESAAVAGSVADPAGATLRYSAEDAPENPDRSLQPGAVAAGSDQCAPSARGSLDEFLLERYTIFTHDQGTDRLCRLWHRPWPKRPLNLRVEDHGLLAQTGPWLAHARLAGAHDSPGVADAWMGRPTCINGPACTRPWQVRG